MAVYNYSNTSVETTLASGIVGGSTTISLTSSAGLPVSYPYTLILDYGAANVEVVSVTGPSGGNFAVTRGEDGTAAQSHNAGARVVHGVVGRDLKVAQDHIAASSAVHGVTGSVVGHTDTQTLTNKTISGASNTLSNIGDASITALAATKLTGSFNAITSTGAVQGTAVTATTGAVTATAGAVTAGTTVTGQGAGNTAGLVADVPNANTSDLLTLKRNSVVKANVDKDGNISVPNVAASGTLAVTGASTLTGAVTANGGVTSSGTIAGATVNATGDLQVNAVSQGRGLMFTTSANTSVTTTGITMVLNPATNFVWKAGRCYAVVIRGRLGVAVTDSVAVFKLLRGTTTGASTAIDFGGQRGLAGQILTVDITVWIKNGTGADIIQTVQLSLGGTASVTWDGGAGSPQIPRSMSIIDVGAASDYGATALDI